MQRNCLILTQSREHDYNDIVGRIYHFPKKYKSQFNDLPAEFVYYEPTKGGEGVYFGYGKIRISPDKDKKEPQHFFVQIEDYKTFLQPVPVKDPDGVHRETHSPHYNPQNAVRKVPAEILDEICLDGKILLNFRADAHLIQVLGEQLIASEKVGILELIKNAYDAGASYCRVRIENVPALLPFDKDQYLFPDLPGPVIIIEDDGCGMTRDVIERGWLRPASRIKTVVKDNLKIEKEKALKQGKFASYNKLIEEIKKERGGRIPLGEKGVGRFAAHRLGRKLLLTTKVSDLDYEFILDVDWDQFDSVGDEINDLESVNISLSRQAPSRDYIANGSGTQLVIYGAREDFDWDEDVIRELNRSICSLNSPNPNPNATDKGLGFTAYLECPQLGELPSGNPSDTFPPTFSFEGIVDERGLLDYSLKFQPPRNVPMPPDEWEEKGYDLRSADRDYWLVNKDDKEFRKPECGQFYLHVDVWRRRAPWVTTGPDRKPFIDYLTDFGGISIFRDGINIFPAEWGANTDWLGLSKPHIKQHFRLSYYNMIGNLELDQTKNLDLIDKTNREGLIRNRAYQDLAKLVKTSVEIIIEKQFIGKQEEYKKLTESAVRDPNVLKEYAKQGAAIITGIKDKYPVHEDPYKILDKLGNIAERRNNLVNLSNSLKNLQTSIQLIEDAQHLLTEQAGFGLAVAVSIHEIAKIASNFYTGVSQVLKSKEPEFDRLNDLKHASKSLQSELKRLSPLRAIRTETQSEFVITKPIKYVISIFRPKLNKYGIKVDLSFNQDFKIYTRYGAMIQIFANLFDNSCYWLSTIGRKARNLKVHIDSKHRTVTVADSGPGIGEAILPYLFQPGYSMKIPPSGLGLYICRYYMHNMKGDIYLTNDRERLTEMDGAQFTLDFNRVASKRLMKGKK